jgi:RWD domain/DRG Family Regulatory Proteins, Tma46
LETKPPRFLTLAVEYPEEYPLVVPILSIEQSDGSFLVDDDEEDEEDESEDEQPFVDIDHEAVVGAQIEDFSSQEIKNLSDILSENAEENIGMPSIFSLASLLKDNAEELFGEKLKQKQREREQELLAQEEKEQQKFRGTPVTPESFAEWRLKFRDEMKVGEIHATVVSGRLTGKQIFERGLNKEEDEDEDADEEEAEELEKGVNDLHV